MSKGRPFPLCHHFCRDSNIFLVDNSFFRALDIKYFSSEFPGLIEIPFIIDDSQIRVQTRLQKSFFVGDSE